MLDAKTGKPRTVIDIAKAAELCVSEESRDGLRIRKYRGSPDSPDNQRQTRLLESFPLALLGFSLRWAHFLNRLCQIFNFCWVRLRKGWACQLIRLGEELLGSSIDFSRNLGRVRLREEMLVHFQNGQEEF